MQKKGLPTIVTKLSRLEHYNLHLRALICTARRIVSTVRVMEDTAAHVTAQALKQLALQSIVVHHCQVPGVMRLLQLHFGNRKQL